MKSIGIIGSSGFVGTAIKEGLKHAFSMYCYDKKRYDIIEKYSNDENSVIKMPKCPFRFLVEKVDGPIFICVPTPMNKNGSCNISIVESVVKSLSDASKDLENKPTTVIKSTVIPGTTDQLDDKFDNVNVIFNPEFLTERSAIQDFKNMKHTIIGGRRPASNILKQMYQVAYPNIGITKTSSTIAEMIKYMTNCFLATKISFANEIYQICEALDIDYDKVVEYATLNDQRLGTSHWSVPGPTPSSDGSNKLLPGFSGACFPKDLNALISHACNLGVDPKVMQAAWEKNLEVRPEKDWENLKGRSVTE